MSGYKNLAVYKTSYEAALQIHKLTQSFPQHELYEIQAVEQSKIENQKSTVEKG